MAKTKTVLTVNNERKRAINWKKIWENKLFYLLPLPGIIYLIIFKCIPMAGLYLAFERYTFQGGLFGSEFVGLKNFEFFFRNWETAMRATRNTLVINLMSILLGIVVNVAVALAVNEIRKKRFRTISQSLMLFPYFISWIALGAIAQAFLDGEHGLINQFLAIFGIPPVDWYLNPDYWWPIMIFVRIWKNAGYSSLIYYAALLNFDTALYEAAEIDGASRWQRIIHITIPMLRPTIAIMFLLSVGNVLAGSVDEIMGMTQLNPMLLERTDTIATYVYRTAIMNNQMESASAITLYQSMFGFIFVMIANTIVKKIDPDYALF